MAMVGTGAAVGRTKFLMEYMMEVRKWDREVTGIPYGTSSTLQSLDVFHHPNPNPTKTPIPVVVFVHGGAWSHGSRVLYRTLGRRVRDEGYVSVVVGYRRYPVGTAIDQSDDVGAALEWVVNNIGNYGGDSGSVILIGHSSGAHISTLHLLSPKNPKNKHRVGAFISLCGVFDVAKHYQWERGRGVEEVRWENVRVFNQQVVTILIFPSHHHHHHHGRRYQL
jgi:acetyl esterase/lipase